MEFEITKVNSIFKQAYIKFVDIKKMFLVCQICCVLHLSFHINEPGHNKTYNKTYVTSEDSDQPANLHSLIRVFTDRMCLLQPPGYPKRDKRELLPYWVSVQANLSLC